MIHEVLHEVAPCLHAAGRSVGRAAWWRSPCNSVNGRHQIQRHIHRTLLSTTTASSTTCQTVCRHACDSCKMASSTTWCTFSWCEYVIRAAHHPKAPVTLQVRRIFGSTLRESAGSCCGTHQAAQRQHEGEGVDGARLHLRCRDVRLRQGQRRVLRNQSHAVRGWACVAVCDAVHVPSRHSSCKQRLSLSAS